ncbi:VOC family protein [Paenibacillus jilunlii]|uniref:Catechol 2,3-dioxygenase n=1 Tax=Paenibacillus jilunlii TaxID=682956 RepID=A0A1G9P4E3_9BACL|nr:VOC family protein [Paenibacillus jilunlii]KWX70786.1 glyoxalase [Paenibacillus jilunlii]SDL93752.1 Catechol 2,3-dioxygenase [Paenibacillus jilunlii]
MKIHRIDHVGVVVNDLSKAKAFFLDFGFEVQGEWEAEGDSLDRIVGLSGVKTACVGLGTPDGQTWIELIQYISPSDEREIQLPCANTPGIRHLAFVVEDIEAIVAKLKNKGMDVFSEIQHYEGSYKLCYCRGPEGIILELGERIR